MSINEAIGSNAKMYHQCTSCDVDNVFDIIKFIMENGLTPFDIRDEGEGIWFCLGQPYYNNEFHPMFSLLDSQENFEKYNFNPLFDGEIRIARKPIPYQELTVENIPFAISNNRNLLYTKDKKFYNMFAEKYGYSSIAEFLANNNNFEHLVVYTDLFDEYVENGTSFIFNDYPHIETRTLF